MLGHIIRTYLQLFRIHTSALTWGAGLIGYAVAGGDILSLEGLYIVIFGLLWHGSGFLDNNVMDYEYDIKDPAKKHFPMVTGEVSFYTADFLVKAGFIATLSLGVWMGGTNTSVIYPLFIMGISGVIYNRYNKRHYWKGFPIALCFTMVPLFTYMTVGFEPTNIIILVLLYVFAQVYFQITVSGELKEIEAASEKSILRSFGARVVPSRLGGKMLVDNQGVVLYGLLLKIIHLIFGIVISKMNPLIILFAFIIVFGPTRTLLRGGNWDRKKRLRDMSIVEILSYFLLVFALYPIIGPIEILFLIIAPVVWFIVMNRVMWGSIIGPRV